MVILLNSLSLKMKLLKILMTEKNNSLNNSRQRYAPRKQLTGNRKVYDIDFSSDEDSFEKISYLNRKENFEGNVRYLGLKKGKKTNAIFLTSEQRPTPQVDNIDVILLLEERAV